MIGSRTRRAGSPSIESIYRGAPQDYVDELMRYRATHPLRSRLIDGVKWNYILSGEGTQPVLILGGAMSTAESSRSLAASLEGDFRILAPAYPVYTRLGAYLDGLAQLLELEGLEQVHFFGQSLGAGVGHAFTRRHPHKVDKLILSSFGLYNKHNLRQAKWSLRLFRLLPYGFVSGYYKRRMPRLLAGLDPGELAFWLAYMDDVLDLQLNKPILMSQFKILEDLFENPVEYRTYAPLQSQNVLILQTKDDTGFALDEQAALRQTYPNARSHLFAQGGHLARATQRDEYDAVLQAFLKTGIA